MTRNGRMMSRFLLATAAGLALAGCTLGGEGELQQWMTEVKQGMRPMVQPVPEPKQFTPQAYEAKGVVDPFDPQKVVMAVARQQQARASASAIKPDLDRRRETLEGFPLDQIRMVGMLQQAGSNVALVESNGTTHMVRVGNYVGQNFGLVTRISETEVQLKEIVQDAAGEWVERPAKLELQEAAAGQQQQGRRR
jgi:type IV pilus assembly protein PilP